MPAKNTKTTESKAKELTGKNLKATRTALGLSQASFAAGIGVTERTIWNYEHGVSALPFSTRLAIIERYNRDPLSTEQLRIDLELSQPMQQDLTSLTPNQVDGFLPRWRKELTDFRVGHHSHFHQRVLRTRDNVYAATTGYFGINHAALLLGVPIGIEVNGVDWIFVCSFTTICCYFV